MEQESVLNFDLDAGMLVVESLVGGKVLMRIQESDPAKTAEVTPAKRLWLTQNMFEPLLRTEAHRFGAQQKFSTNVVHYEEQADGVIVIVQDLETKKYFKYKTDYLVATDGSRSATRKFEGIEWRGPGIQSNNISVNFRADLTPYLGSRAVHGVTYITNPKISAGFRLEGAGKAGFMIVSSTKDRQEFEPDSVTADEAKQYFCDASGIKAEIDIQVDSVSYWTAAAFNADHYSSKRGRVFLAGDAAHVVPPTGGMGGNTGIQVCCECW
jgi:2-polyprenyl-6-methoxyphenol hydroxylase-like FAD-dependent oxidoreductase